MEPTPECRLSYSDRTVRLASLVVPCAAFLGGLLAACDRPSEGPSHSSAAPAPGTASATSAVPDVPETPAPAALRPHAPTEAFIRAMTVVEQAIEAGDYVRADQQLDAAAGAAANDVHLLFAVALYRATRFAYSGDFERAATALTAMVPDLAKHPESPDEFSAHNQLMILRAAAGKPSLALAEDDQATQAAARGTWAPEERPTLAYLKDRWHRAYLTRMLAQTRAGAERQALIRDAEAALGDYRTRARQLHTNEDSIAVLEAYFAALDGKGDAALRAAKRVDPVEDGDLEDLYLVVVGLEAGGDHARAEAVRKLMRQPGDVHISRAVMLRWLDSDAKASGEKVFTPWHPF